MFRSEAVHKRRSPRKMLRKHDANSQENNHAEAQSQQRHFGILLKSHPRTDVPQNWQQGRKHDFPGEKLFASVCQKSFERVKL